MMKKPSILLAVLSLAAVLLATPTSAVQPTAIAPGADSGSFYTYPGTFEIGDAITLVGNFDDSVAGQTVTFYKNSGGSWTSVGSDEANSGGNAYLTGHVINTTETIYARAGSRSTEVATLRPIDPNAPTAIELKSPFEVDSYRLRPDAVFKGALRKPGTYGYLQVKRIKDDRWVTIDKRTQDANGKVDFYLGNPLEVEHEYRAVPSGAAVKSNIVKARGPLLDKNTGLATVHFNSNDGESVNTRSHYFDGEFAMKAGANCEAEGIEQGPGEELKAEMKGRGNYSWSFDKKGFTLKLDKGKNLCDMGDSKKWALVANHYDRSLLRNDVAYWVGKQFDNLAWTPDQMPVDLYVNGSYRGNYSLVERITSTGNDTPADGGRVAIPEDKDGESPAASGYIMEWDFRHDAFHNFWVDGRGWVGLKEPEDEEYTTPRYDYIHSYVEKADAALCGHGNWRAYIDEASAIDYYLAMEYLKPVDGNMWASVYMYKPANGKIRMGPLWDFDMGLGSANRAGGVKNWYSWYLRNNLQISAMQPRDRYPKFDTWFNCLNQDSSFRSAARARWNQLQVGNQVDPSGFIASRKALIDESAHENYQKWSYSHKISKYQMIESNWDEDVDRLDRWMELREDWMDDNL